MKPTVEFLSQYNALTAGVGISLLAGRTIIEVTGADRTQFLQSFTTNDIKLLTPGRGCEAFVTSTQGKTLGHVLILSEAEKYLLDTTPGQAAALISHFERYVITEDVQFTDRTAQLCDILIAGPNATALLDTVTGANPPAELYSSALVEIAGRRASLSRVEYAGPTTYFVQTSSEEAPAIVAALSASGAIRCDPVVVESARLEAGMPLYGLDITPDNLPQEVARDDRAISFTKGCYLGQETVARIDAIGHVNRLLVGLKFRGEEMPACGMPLLAADQQVGHVTSAGWSPRLGAPLALGYVRRPYSKPATQLTSTLGPVEVIKLPLT
jgi:folate-binding protein YgfZ